VTSYFGKCPAVIGKEQRMPKPAEDNTQFYQDTAMDYETLLELAKKRRSCRRFKPGSIPDDCVDKIIEVARWAPSGANSQPWEFIVIKDDELKGKIVGVIKDLQHLNFKIELTRPKALRYPGQTMPVAEYGYEKAPVFILVCGDTRTKDAYPLYEAADAGQTVFDSSLAIAMLYMHLVATTLGLGSQWITASRAWSVQCIVRELLAIPKELEIYDMMAVGKVVSDPPPRLVRSKDEIVHYDKYDMRKFRTEQEISNFIAAIRKHRTYSGMGR